MSILTTSPEFVRPGSESEPSWREELRLAVRDTHELCLRLGLPAELASAAEPAASQFPVFVPPSFLARMHPGDPQDPLLRQVLPLVDENTKHPEFTDDPVGDAAATLQAGVLQKYAGRALLITTEGI